MPRAPAAPPADDYNSPYSARSQPGMSTTYTQQGKGKAHIYVQGFNGGVFSLKLP